MKPDPATYKDPARHRKINEEVYPPVDNKNLNVARQDVLDRKEAASR
jgi:hypothetical protein